MNKRQIILFTFAASLLAACSVVPITGRRQINLASNAEILQSSALQYRQFLSKSRLSANATVNRRISTVGKRIAKATTAYLSTNGMADDAAQMNWEFNVIESPQVNAFCMPGGKIVVYTGLLRVAKTDDQLAAVIGHEVSHAIAHHANERISQAMLQQLGGNALGIALSGKSVALQQVMGQVYGVGTQLLVMLPYNRTQEYEADKLGLVFMAMAGYDPRAAVDLWRAMSTQGTGGKLEFLSTHPSDENRIRAIEAYLPEVQKYIRR